MRVLMIGDVVGQAGCAHLSRVLPMLRRTYAPDVVIANGESPEVLYDIVEGRQVGTRFLGKK